ncbi:MAG: F0F1 ATP synthase subunit epsilon [Flavobacteriaceae bacterium]|nr:F0F1 ATP synthase subunit epsilon [Flavobacteriaceae bacterium]
MYLEIISPEATLFTGNIDSLTVPGTNGSFQVLENHASIVSTLTTGDVTLQGNFDSSNNFDEPFNKIDPNSVILKISSGTLELQDNKIILLVD